MCDFGLLFTALLTIFPIIVLWACSTGRRPWIRSWIWVGTVEGLPQHCLPLFKPGPACLYFAAFFKATDSKYVCFQKPYCHWCRRDHSSDCLRHASCPCNCMHLACIQAQDTFIINWWPWYAPKKGGTICQLVWVGTKAIGKCITHVFLQHSGHGVGEKNQIMNHRIIVYIVLIGLCLHCANPTIKQNRMAYIWLAETTARGTAAGNDLVRYGASVQAMDCISVANVSATL